MKSVAHLINSLDATMEPLGLRLPAQASGRTRNPFASQAIVHTLKDADRAGRIAWLRRIKVKEALRAYYDAPDAESSASYWEGLK